MNAEQAQSGYLFVVRQNRRTSPNLYTTLIPDSRVTNVVRTNPNGPPLLVEFELAGVPFQGLNGGPHYQLNEAASISITTKDQSETDRLWSALTANGGSESRCGWLKDRFGLSWQIIPEALHRCLGSSDREAAERAMNAMLTMGKIDIAQLEAAFKAK